MVEIGWEQSQHPYFSGNWFNPWVDKQVDHHETLKTYYIIRLRQNVLSTLQVCGLHLRSVEKVWQNLQSCPNIRFTARNGWRRSEDYSQPSTDNLTHYYDPVTQTNCSLVPACSNGGQVLWSLEGLVFDFGSSLNCRWNQGTIGTCMVYIAYDLAHADFIHHKFVNIIFPCTLVVVGFVAPVSCARYTLP